MIQIIEQTKEEKVKMYNKLSKKELIEMLIEANRHLNNRQPTITYPDQVPYNEICSCNPLNGGSGICGCIMANQMVDYNPNITIEYTIDLNVNCSCGQGIKVLGENYCRKCLGDNPLLCN